MSKSTTNNKEDWSGGDGILPGRAVWGPLVLMLTTPCFSICFYHVVAHMNSDFMAFVQLILTQGLIPTLWKIWPSPWNVTSWKYIATFFVFELVLMKILPGKSFQATVTPKGNVPVYKANGMACYLVTLSTLLGLSYFGVIRPSIVYDLFGNILSSLNMFALLFCVMLLVKGHVAPSTTDSGSNGSIVMDYYWGMELYPNILGWDVKQFTNCRAGMMFWAVGIVCFAFKNVQEHQGQLQLGMAINVALQLIYITKFFYWEMGYMCSMDIQHDRAGYYICWGCLVWVPSVYTSSSFYLATHAPPLSTSVGLFLFMFGFAMIFVNYDSDRQRYVFRQTHGKCTLWGKTPRKIVAQYISNGKECTSLLLCDGWWRWSRHFHYVPEILSSLAWSMPALDSAVFGPYFYVLFLTILLTDRAFRDDDRCRKKYGTDWDTYCQVVPYKIVPGIV